MLGHMTHMTNYKTNILLPQNLDWLYVWSYQFSHALENI